MIPRRNFVKEAGFLLSRGMGWLVPSYEVLWSGDRWEEHLLV